MKKFFIVCAVAIGLYFGFISNYVGASVNDFVIKDFQADYYLDVDSNGRSTLRTVETIVTIFPDYDQNHGIERALPTTYDGHSTSLDVQSVKNQNGEALSYSTSRQGDNLVLRIGDANVYVHNQQTYVISYLQKDVTRYFSNTDSDEFYWDVNGTGWYQPFSKITARLHLGQALGDKLNSQSSCYYGVSGSAKKCDISIIDGVISASLNNLSIGENMTIAVGFQPDTFADYKMTVSGFIQRYLTFVSIILGLIGLVVLLFLKYTKGKNSPGRGTVVAQYLPPKDADIAIASVIKKHNLAWAAATVIDLAVRHKLKVIEIDKNKFSLEYINSDKLTDNELSVIKAYFGDNPTKGDRYDIEKNRANTKLAYKLSTIYRQVKRWLNNNDYYKDIKRLRIAMLIVVVVITLQPFIILFFSKSGVTLFEGFLPFLSMVLAFLGMMIIVLTKPLSIKGRELLDYLKGLEMYIKTAEKDRIKYLQSPQGAYKTPINTDNKALVLKLYERVLPYAVLFGHEKEWVKTIGKYYEQQESNPDWYVGQTAFSAAVFSSAFSNFSSNVKHNSYYTSSNSSSGGSSGGGFSGGGGGGGGGGGW